MEACMMKPGVKKKPKPRPVSTPPKPPEIRRYDPERPEEPAPVVPPRPMDAELVHTQFRVKRLAAAFDEQANGSLNQPETKEKRSETPVVPPRSKAKELNSVARSSQAEGTQGSAQRDQAVDAKDEADFKQSNQQGLVGIFRKSQKEKAPSFPAYKTHNLDEEEKGDDVPVKQAPSSKPTSRDPSPDARAEEAGAQQEPPADKDRLGKNAEPKQEKGGFFSGILKKPNKPADGTSPRATRDPSPDPAADEGGAEKEQSAEKSKQDKVVEPKQEKGGLLAGMFRKTPKEKPTTSAPAASKTESDNEDTEEEDKSEHTHGGFFSGILKKSNKPADDAPAQENLSVPAELSASSDSLSENKEKGGIFSGMFKKSPKPAETDQDKESLQTEKSASSENLTENSSAKEKGGGFGAMFKKAPKPSRPEGEKKSEDELSGSTEGLTESSNKEKGGIFSGIFKKPQKPAEAAQSEEELSSDTELSASSENLSENKQEKGGGLFSGLRKKTPKASGEKTESLEGETQKELSASNDDLSENTSGKEKNIFSNMFKRPQKPAETESEGNAESQLSGSTENLMDPTVPKEKKGGLADMFKRSASVEFDLFDEEGGGLFSGLLKKTPKASGDEAAEDKSSERELSSSTDNLIENSGTKEKNIFSGMFKKTPKPADEESGEEKKLSASCENLSEGKEKTGGLAGLFKKSPKPAPRTVTKQDPLSDLKRSGSLDSLSDDEEENLSARGELSGSRENLEATKEKKGGFAGMFRRTPKNEEGGEDAQAPAGGGLRRKRTIKKKQRVVSFRVKKTLPRFPKLNLASQSSESLPAVEETVELEDLNPVQENTVEVQPVEMAAFPTEDAPLQSELENNELIEWWNSVKGWTEWTETSNFGEEDGQMAMEQAADRVYMAARLFVHLFNQRGASLQHRILELLALADAADHFHKKTTTAAVGGGVASVAGSVTTITGLILAPFTFGASIIVTAVGIGVATAGSIASATANITDTVHSNMDRKKLEKMIQDYQEEIKDIRECMEFVQEGMDTLEEWDFEKYSQSAASKAMNHNIKHVVKEGGRAGKALMINTDKLISTVQVLGAAGGVAKAAQAISVTTGVMSALFLALDIFFLAKDSHKLRKGAKTKFASKIRDVCKDLQDGLLELNKVKTQLQKTMEGIEVEEYEEIEEVEVEVEDDLESDPKKLAELEQELDLMEEKLDKKIEEEQRKKREMENLKAKEKKEMSMKEKGEQDEKEDTKEKADKDETKKEKDKGDSSSEAKTESEEEKAQKSPKEEHSIEQSQKGSKKEKETENWITAGKHESKRDAIKDETVMERKEPEVSSRAGDSMRSDRHVKTYSEWDTTERESGKRSRRSSREDGGGIVKPEWNAANPEREAGSRSTRRHSSRSDRDEERGDKQNERRGSHRSNRDSAGTESWRTKAEDERGARDGRAEAAKGRAEWRETKETRGEDHTRRTSHRSHETSTRREHSERERASGRRESARSHRSERGESRRQSDKTGGEEKEEEREDREVRREHGGSRRRGSDKDGEHHHSRRGSRPRTNALLDDGLYI